MQKILALMVRGIILVIQSLPLSLLGRVGRMGGSICWYLDNRHRAVMLDNLAAAFPAKPIEEIRQIARENIRRIGENYLSALKTCLMDLESLDRLCSVRGLEKIPDFTKPGAPRNCVVAIGHFGNFELYAILSNKVRGLRPAATYRGLNQPVFNEVLKLLRAKSGCTFYERRTEGPALRKALNKGGLMLGLLADQHSGSGGLWGPFLGRHCSTTQAPAVLALRYDAALFTSVCFRTGLGTWSIEIGDRIPTHENGHPRPVQAITQDVNRFLEKAILRDPANWFWVHNRWKAQSAKQNRYASGEGVLQVDPAMEPGSL